MASGASDPEVVQGAGSRRDRRPRRRPDAHDGGDQVRMRSSTSRWRSRAPKGTVVIVGDVGLNVERDSFLPQGDRSADEHARTGRAGTTPRTRSRATTIRSRYVRWTLNRNMQAYLDLMATRPASTSQPLIDRVISVDEAPAAYRALAKATAALPLGVLIRYPDDDARAAGASRRDAGHRSAAIGRRRPGRSTTRWSAPARSARRCSCRR